jgi:hypothetical protein
MSKIMEAQAKPVQQDTVPYMTKDGKTVLINERDPRSQAVIDQQGLVPVSAWKAGEKGDTAHGVVEVPSSDGTSARKMQYNPETKRYDIPVGPAYKVRSQVMNINTNTASDAEIEVMASLLAEGKINPGDVSKRGSIAPKVFKRAQELNPALDPRGAAADNAGYQATIQLQEKQYGQMGSFVKNMDKQIDRVKDISKELKSFDTRLLNVPLRAVRGRIAGSPAQAKYDMYITEIENEIGKLATGSAASISELSVGAQEKWAKIHDKNLSISDMIKLLEETKHAGRLRMESVKEQIADTKKRRQERGGTTPKEDPLGIR